MFSAEQNNFFYKKNEKKENERNHLEKEKR